MELTSFNEKHVSDNIGLLISILMRHPEVGTIHLEPNNNLLKLTFVLSHQVSETQIKDFEEELRQCLNAFNFLMNKTAGKLSVNCWQHQGVALIELQGAVQSLNQNEIAMHIALIKKQFKQLLVMDEASFYSDLDLDYQEELISNVLANIDTDDHPSGKFIAFREEGKVLVFNK